MIGSCGCFGREDTPPHALHVVLDVVLASVASIAALTTGRSVVDELVDHPGAAFAVVPLAAIALYLLYAAFVHLPRTLAAARLVSR
jgi:hypothetical protein